MFLSFDIFDIAIRGFRSIVPVGLHVGGQTDHTVFLEVAAEGILFTLSVLSFLFSSQVAMSPFGILR